MADDAIQKISGKALITQSEFNTTKKIEKKDEAGNVSVFYVMEEDDGKTLINLSEKQFKALTDIYGFNPTETNKENKTSLFGMMPQHKRGRWSKEERARIEAEIKAEKEKMENEEVKKAEEHFTNPTEEDLAGFEDDMVQDEPSPEEEIFSNPTEEALKAFEDDIVDEKLENEQARETSKSKTNHEVVPKTTLFKHNEINLHK